MSCTSLADVGSACALASSLPGSELLPKVCTGIVRGGTSLMASLLFASGARPVVLAASCNESPSIGMGDFDELRLYIPLVGLLPPTAPSEGDLLVEA